MIQPFAETNAFKVGVLEAFKKIDTNNSGSIDKDELLVAMCHLHYTLKDKTPGVTDAPSGESVRALLAEHDMDGSGTLSLEEFQTLAATWYKRDAIVFAEKLLLSSFIGMVALPGAAELLHGQVPIMRRVPKMVFKVIFGIAFKIIATSIPSRG